MAFLNLKEKYMLNLILCGMFVAGALIGGICLWRFLTIMDDFNWGFDDEDFL